MIPTDITMVPFFMGEDILVGFLLSVIEGVSSFVGKFLSKAAVTFITIEPPSGSSATYVNSAYALREKCFTVFPFLLVLMLMFAVGTAPISNRKKVEPWRLFRRFTAVVVMVLFFYPVFDLSVELVNDLVIYFAPETYQLDLIGPGYKNKIQGVVGGGLTLVVGYLIFSSVGIISVVAFLLTVMARQFIIYLTWASFPILMCLWFFDFGPLKSLKSVADTLFNATAFLIGVGPIISLGMNLGAASVGG